jgi:predicted RNA-binding protein with PIN domain
MSAVPEIPDDAGSEPEAPPAFDAPLGSSGEAPQVPDAASETPPQPYGSLPEPARRRLVHLASQALAGLAPEDVPPPLRHLANFTPAKRERFGATALLRQVAEDATFRGRVEEAFRQVAPLLVDTVADTPTGTIDLLLTDPLDVLVVAAVSASPAAPRLVEVLSERWREVELDREAARATNARLREELQEARRKCRALEASLREAQRSVAQPSPAATEEISRLRTKLRTRAAELRASERQAESLRSELEDANRSAQARIDELETSSRSRIAELERAVTAARGARREARAERDHDAARLQLLLDTLLDAAAGLRRELDLPAVAVRPADAVSAETGTGATARPAARTVPDTTALQRLLDLPQLHLIVDGYNVTKTGYPQLSLADQRARLLGALATLRGRTDLEATVVFDGAERPPVQPRAPRGVRLLFSAPGQTADDVIRDLVSVEPPGRPVAVVTSDGAVIADVARAGAWTVPSSVLVDLLG